MHLRAEIKAKIKELLTAQSGGGYVTLVGARVYCDRYQPLSDDPGEEAHLPAIRVYCLPETNAEVDNLQDRRTTDVSIECIANGADADSVLDQLTNQVELELLRDRTLGGLVEDMRLSRCEPGVDEESQGTIQAVKMLYQVTYIVPSTVPEQYGTTDAFVHAQVDYTSPQAADHVDLAQ